MLTNIDVILQMVDDYDLDEEETARVYGRLAALREAVQAEEKSMGWRLRARVGRRVAWRRTIEDTEGTRRHRAGVGLAPRPRLTRRRRARPDRRSRRPRGID